MARAVLVLVLVFLALAVLRALRVLLARSLDRSRAAKRPPPIEGEMARRVIRA